MGWPTGCWHDDLVTRIEHGAENIGEQGLCAGMHKDLLMVIVELVVAFEFGLDRRLHRCCAIDGCVFRLTTVDGVLGGNLDVVRRVEVRLPCRKSLPVAGLLLSALRQD